MYYSLKYLPILARDDRDGLYQSAKHQPYHHEHHPHPKADIRSHEPNVNQIQRTTHKRDYQQERECCKEEFHVKLFYLPWKLQHTHYFYNQQHLLNNYRVLYLSDVKYPAYLS